MDWEWLSSKSTDRHEAEILLLFRARYVECVAMIRRGGGECEAGGWRVVNWRNGSELTHRWVTEVLSPLFCHKYKRVNLLSDDSLAFGNENRK